MAEAAQAAGEVMWRSRVGLCDDAARQGAVPPRPVRRLHTPTVLLCTPTPRGEASVRVHVHLPPFMLFMLFTNKLRFSA